MAMDSATAIVDSPASGANTTANTTNTTTTNNMTTSTTTTTTITSTLAHEELVVEEQGMVEMREAFAASAQATARTAMDPDARHPLQHEWTLWYDSPQKKTNQQNWADNLKQIISFHTVEDFWG